MDVRACAAELDAQALPVALGLPGVCWQIATQLGETYRSMGNLARAAATLEGATNLVNSLAPRINDHPLHQALLPDGAGTLLRS